MKKRWKKNKEHLEAKGIYDGIYSSKEEAEYWTKFYKEEAKDDKVFLEQNNCKNYDDYWKKVELELKEREEKTIEREKLCGGGVQHKYEFIGVCSETQMWKFRYDDVTKQGEKIFSEVTPDGNMIEKIKEKMQIYGIKLNKNFTGTSIEIALQHALENKGIEYLIQAPIFGRPDIFIEPNICIFCDGDYWHGEKRLEQQRRDKEVTEYLTEHNYTVVRFLEHEINDNIEDCIDKIERLIKLLGYNV